jgi:hypothetical protein
MFFIVGVGIVANLVATVPCLWGGFVAAANLIPLGFSWLPYCLLVTGIELGLIGLVEHSPPDWGHVFGIIYLLNLTQCAVVFGVMRVYRALGYRLERVPREMSSTEELQKTWETVLVETEPDITLPKADVE